MWSSRKRSNVTQLGHDKLDVLGFDTVLLHKT